MATHSQLMKSEWSEINKVSNTRIDADTWYTIQNRSHLTAFIQVSASAPQNTNGAFSLAPNETMQVKITGTEKAWVFQSDSSGTGSYGLLIVDSAA